jgi:hypothetical protein
MINDLKTLPAHVDFLRQYLKEFSSDSNVNLPTMFLYKALIDARNRLIKQRADKKKPLLSSNFQTICIPLEKTTFYDCSCLPTEVQCMVLRSKFKIPARIRNGLRELIDVYNSSMEYQLSQTSKSKLRLQKKLSMSNHHRDPRLSFDLIDDYLYIFNDSTNSLPLVVAQVLFEDPTSVADLDECQSLDNGPCYDINNSVFPIDGDLNEAMYKMALQILTPRLDIPENKSNDRDASIKDH